VWDGFFSGDVTPSPNVQYPDVGELADASVPLSMSDDCPVFQ